MEESEVTKYKEMLIEMRNQLNLLNEEIRELKIMVDEWNHVLRIMTDILRTCE